MQEVYCKLLRYQPAFRDAEHEKAWLIRATIHQAADMRRARSRQNLPLDEASTVCADEPSDLLSCVRALPDRYAVVIHLHYYEGYKLSEIAKLLALPTATVGTRLARGRARLKQMLEE